MILGTKLILNNILKMNYVKLVKLLGQNILLGESLLTIYKSFMRPHIHCGDVIYDQLYNNTFH